MISPSPTLSLEAILLYGITSFIIGIIATPSFLSFLHKNKLGKQLRTAAVDGKSASVFQKYHKDKQGTPTMGGLLIWGTVLVTVLLSRALSFFGIVTFSIFQRGEVYLPLFTLFSFGILGAIDDYWNILGRGSKKGLDVLPKLLKVDVTSVSLQSLL